MATALRERSDAQIGRGVSAQEIRVAEETVGRVPDDYRAFLRDFGWAIFNGYEFWGLGVEPPAFGTLSFVEETVRWRADYGLPAHMIGFYDDGGGNIECFPAEPSTVDGQSGVFFHFHEDRQLYRDADSFVDFMMERLRQPPFFDNDGNG